MRYRLYTALLITVAAIAAITCTAALATSAARAAMTAAMLANTSGPAGPVCIGLIVTSCYASDASTSEPARTSPALFLLILILGAVAVQWMNTQAWQHPIDVDDEEATGCRRLDEEDEAPTDTRGEADTRGAK